MVIWCEHDLFDQLLLIRHLAWFAERDSGRTTLALICIGEFPGLPHFKGLGELGPHQLASLLGTRLGVTQRQLELGRRAFRTALPFLARALRRLLEEYPSTRTGLSHTEQELLSLLAAGGRMRVRDLVRAMHARESAYYVTDVTMRGLLARFGGERPLVVTEPAASGREWDTMAELTALGRAVLAGRADWVRLRGGVDRWLGGVHLSGAEPAWRWDAEAQRRAETPVNAGP